MFCFQNVQKRKRSELFYIFQISLMSSLRALDSNIYFCDQSFVILCFGWSIERNSGVAQICGLVREDLEVSLKGSWGRLKSWNHNWRIASLRHWRNGEASRWFPALASCQSWRNGIGKYWRPGHLLFAFRLSLPWLSVPGIIHVHIVLPKRS